MVNSGALNLLGGSALLLYSIEGLSSSIQYLAGSKFRASINILAGNRFYGLVLGMVLALFLSSSGAVTVMLVSLANARLLAMEQIFAVTLGAAIGSTFLVHLFTFKISAYGLLIIAFGASVELCTRDDRAVRIAKGMIYIGILFFSLSLVMSAGEQLQNDEYFRYTINYFKDRPAVSFFISTVITAMIHSSVATVAFVMSMMVAKNGTIYEAIPWILGANLGTTATAFFAAFREGTLGKRVALWYLFCKLGAVSIAFPLMEPFGTLLTRLTNDISRQIAAGHTLFNVFLAILYFPFITLTGKLMKRFVSSGKNESEFTFFYLDSRAENTPELALAQAQREILRVADIVERMLEECIGLFEKRNYEDIERVRGRDQIVDFLNKGIKLFLTKLSQKEMTSQQVQKEFELLVRLNDLEAIGDVIVKNILEHVRKTIKKGYAFSSEGWNEIKDYHGKILGCLRISTAYFNSRDLALLSKLRFISEQIDEMLMDLSEAHVQRLHMGVKQTIDTTSVHLDMLGNLQRISNLAVNFTRIK